jgi:HEAT repeat protein
MGTRPKTNGSGAVLRNVRQLVEQLTRASGHDARQPLRARLARLGASAAPGLVEALGHEDEFTRWEAVSLLGELAVPEAATDVARFALNEDEVHARWRSFWAVSRFPQELTRPILLRALKGKNSKRRWRAALVLNLLGDPICSREIVSGLDADEEWKQWEALSALKAMPVAGTERRVARFLDAGCERGLRQEAVLALGALGGAAACKHLREALSDEEPEVRWRASMALSRAAGARAADWLKDRLNVETDDDVKQQLAEDLKELT